MITITDIVSEIYHWLRGGRPHPIVMRSVGLLVGYSRLVFLVAAKVILWPWRTRVTSWLLKNSFYFDGEYYLRTNEDVAQAGIDPLEHFVRYGDREGRCPMLLFNPSFYRARAGKSAALINSILHYRWIGRYQKISPSPWFDSQYYLQHNRDVEQQGFDPLYHYLRWGGKEGRSPNSSFDGSFYLRTYPDVHDAGLNPLLHYIEFGRLEGRQTRPLGTENEEDRATEESRAGTLFDDRWHTGDWETLERSCCPVHSDPQVAVIIPVYRNHRLTWCCLASVLTAHCETASRIVVIDDASPESELSADLAEMARRGWIELIRNEYNLGFVASVNLGITVAHSLDVVLLNADTEVYPGWLDRLHAAAWRHPRTASVTPLSNNATIASYPRFLHDNPYPLEIGYPELDRLAAQCNAGVEVEVPTGVGFCMYLRRDALHAVGLFDEAAFGKGYGEENDWCQRAIQLGWRHIIAADVFVRHFGSASFGGEKAERVRVALETLAAKYPNYHREIQQFIQRDPLRTAREALDWARLAYQVKEENVLIVCHNRGGGAERHVQEDTERFLEAGKGVFYLRPLRGKPSHVRLAHPRCRQLMQAPVFAITDQEGLAQALRRLRISAIHSHGLVDLIPEAAAYLQQLAAQLKIPLDVDIHDYKVICPRINLTDETGHYCGEPDQAACDRCLAMRGSAFPGVTSIARWRQMHHRVLQQARHVWVPDKDVRQRLRRYYPDVTFRIAPHEQIDRVMLRPRRDGQAGEPLHVAVIGAIGKIKGYNIFLACARYAKRYKLPIRFSLLGYSMDDRTLEAAGVAITGRYLESEALERLHRLEPDIVWLPATWPETYSYTLSIALRAGYPVYVFDLGAPAARLRRLGRPEWVLPLAWAKEPQRLINHWLCEIDQKAEMGE